MKKYSYSNKELEGDLLKIARDMALDNWKPDLILAPIRGGLVPGVYLSHYYNVRLAPINLSLRDFKNDAVDLSILSKYENVLIIDDIIDTGETFSLLSEKLLGSDYHQYRTRSGITQVKFASLYYNISNKFDFAPDYYAKEINKAEEDVWIEFPFETWFLK